MVGKMEKREKEWAVLVARSCELARQMKALEEERGSVNAILRARLEEEQIQEWRDPFYAVALVDQPGREFADVKALKEANLMQFVKVGQPSRYVLTRRL